MPRAEASRRGLLLTASRAALRRLRRPLCLLGALALFLAAPAGAQAPPDAPPEGDRVASLEAAIRAEQERLLALISRPAARDAEGFRQIDELRESAERLPDLQRQLAAARRDAKPSGWRSAPE